MREVTIEVTQEDIDNGEQKNFKSCPVAIAISRTIGQPAQVDQESVSLVLTPWDDSIEIPGRASNFISSYDDGDPVSPFSFPLSVPDSWIGGVA